MDLRTCSLEILPGDFMVEAVGWCSGHYVGVGVDYDLTDGIGVVGVVIRHLRALHPHPRALHPLREGPEREVPERAPGKAPCCDIRKIILGGICFGLKL